jgi:predicted PurR-regulated permease PerM
MTHYLRYTVRAELLESSSAIEQEIHMHNKLENQSFLGLLLVVSAAFIWLVSPFFGPVFWAVAITIIFYPVQLRLQARMPNWPSLAAFLTLVLCVVIVVIPVIFTATSVVNQGVELYQRVQSGELDLESVVNQINSSFPVVQNGLERVGVDPENLRDRLVESVMASGKFLAQRTLIIGQNIFGFLLAFGVMLYVAFFLLRDGDRLIVLMIKALPLGDDRERLLFDKFAEVTRATVKGSMVIAIIQGALGGFIFWALGLPGFLLWGVVMAVLSLIPAVGAGLIWGPVAIYMLATGSFAKGLILIAFGVIVIGLVDNLLRPILVGRDTKLPDFVVLISTLGGLVLFGINGFVIGPLIAALFTVLWGIFMREFQHETASELPQGGEEEEEQEQAP